MRIENIRAVRALSSLAVVWMLGLAACDSGGSDPAPTCGEVCDRLTSVCGSAPPSCASVCETSVSETARRCTVAAANCDQALACTSTVADAGTADASSGDECCPAGMTCPTLPCEAFACDCEDGTSGRNRGASVEGVCEEDGAVTCAAFCNPSAYVSAVADGCF